MFRQITRYTAQHLLTSRARKYFLRDEDMFRMPDMCTLYTHPMKARAKNEEIQLKIVGILRVLYISSYIWILVIMSLNKHIEKICFKRIPNNKIKLKYDD